MQATALVAAISMALATALAGCGQEGTGGGSSASGGSSGSSGSMGKTPGGSSGTQDSSKRSTTTPGSK